MTPAAAKKHRTEILAFLDGKTIQKRWDGDEKWSDSTSPVFDEECEYRVKPEPPKTETVYIVTWFEKGRMYTTYYYDFITFHEFFNSQSNATIHPITREIPE